eukprot:scaffold464767_cov17-Prasinocladus_malaysianus.AAC.1
MRFEVVAAHADLHCSRAGGVYTFVSASKIMSLVSCGSSCFHSKPRLNCKARPSLTEKALLGSSPQYQFVARVRLVYDNISIAADHQPTGATTSDLTLT